MFNISFKNHNTIWIWCYYHLHFKDEAIEVEKGEVTVSRAHDY